MTKQDPYKEAGVDVQKGDELVDWLLATDDKSVRSPLGQTVSGIGGFAALFRPDFRGMSDPLLVSGTDGVGTKVLLGLETKQLSGLGIDLVAMCVNDLYTLGARPLFFLDYYATGVLQGGQFKSVLSGIKAGCKQCGAALLGGETAELPGLYEKGHFDLAGFVVGAVDGKKVLGPQHVRSGDRLYAIESSGFHSNGYSLIRRWLKDASLPTDPALLERLMTPTRIYHELPDIVTELGPATVHALANITGGGISGNLPRVMPKGIACHIEKRSIKTAEWMSDFIKAHNSTPHALEGIFNIGVGMIASIAKDSSRAFETACQTAHLPVYEIGEVRADANAEEPHVVFT